MCAPVSNRMYGKLKKTTNKKKRKTDPIKK